MPVPPNVLVFARELRKNQTDAEILLWYILRGRRFCGYKFRRQYPMCGYIIDFYCHDVGLAIELDGGGHNFEEQRLHDDERSKVLEGANIRVVRLWNNDVLNSLEEVLETIYAHLIPDFDITSSPDLRPPSPSGRRIMKDCTLS